VALIKVSLKQKQTDKTYTAGDDTPWRFCQSGNRTTATWCHAPPLTKMTNESVPLKECEAEHPTVQESCALLAVEKFRLILHPYVRKYFQKSSGIIYSFNLFLFLEFACRASRSILKTPVWIFENIRTSYLPYWQHIHWYWNISVLSLSIGIPEYFVVFRSYSRSWNMPPWLLSPSFSIHPLISCDVKNCAVDTASWNTVTHKPAYLSLSQSCQIFILKRKEFTS
jgi:hypothetical protein